ncbi:MAG: G1 family endopeptidase [Actinomycetota bacterium]|nr:G1 family endopeptidase [Actinomycetota bacterium]
MFARLVITVTAVAACSVGLAAPAIAAPPGSQPTVIAHVDQCGGAVTVRHPAHGPLTAQQAGMPKGANLFVKAARMHATWLTDVSCRAVRNRNPRPTASPTPATAALPASGNWSGYVALTTAPTYAQMEWHVPSVKSNGHAAYSSIWPGIGGNSGTGKLIQDGTEQDVTAGGAQTDYFWFEIVPGESQQEVTNLTPRIGDDVETDISWASGTATFAMCDFTHGGCVTGSQSSTAPGNSAEWIVERTQINGQLPQLADFGSVNITNAGYDETHLGNVEYTIANGGQSLAMEGSSGDVLAAPGGVSGGTTFTDYWHHYS